MEMTEVMEQMNAGVARLAAAAEVLESWAGRVRADGEGDGSVGKITAAVEPGVEGWAGREEELQRRLDQALGALAALQAESARVYAQDAACRYGAAAGQAGGGCGGCGGCDDAGCRAGGDERGAEDCGEVAVTADWVVDALGDS
jgi:hypothetical protein